MNWPPAQYLKKLKASRDAALQQRELEFEAVEPRMLFSAAAADPVQEPQEAHHDVPTVQEERVIPITPAEEQESWELQAGAATETPESIVTDLNYYASDIELAERHELVFVSTSVEGYDYILENLDSAYEMFLIDGESDGVLQIANALEGMSDVDAIHIISHGDEGRLYLGNTILTAESMSGEHKAALEAIAQALTEDADILLYGCDFTAGESGVAAATLLGEITGADIAASSNATGHADWGGDWILETEIGGLETSSLAMLGWEGVLAPIAITNTNNANTLANNITGPGITVSSASYSGGNGQSGTFVSANGYSPEWLGYSSGIILTTGNTSQILGPNTAGNASVDAPGAGRDMDLETLGGARSYDSSVLTMTFVPTSNYITMQFTFGSDEYAEYVYSQYNDVMGVWVNGQQVALTPDGKPISVNAINQAETYNPSQGNQNNDPNPGNGVYDSANPNLYKNNAPNSGAYDTGMDGFTVTISFVAEVEMGVENTIKIGISDIGDAQYDSWLFIREGGLVGTTIAFNDYATTSQNTPVVIDAIANDTDDDDYPLEITHVLDIPITAGGAPVTLPSGSTVSLNMDGTLTFDPTNSNDPEEIFTYLISNGHGATALGFVTVNISEPPVNSVPSSVTATEDIPYTITGVSVSDVDSDVLTTTLSLPSETGVLNVVTTGTATITGNGSGEVVISGSVAEVNAAIASITYTPAADFNTGAPSTPIELTVSTSDGGTPVLDTIEINGSSAEFG